MVLLYGTFIFAAERAQCIGATGPRQGKGPLEGALVASARQIRAPSWPTRSGAEPGGHRVGVVGGQEREPESQDLVEGRVAEDGQRPAGPHRLDDRLAEPLAPG